MIHVVSLNHVITKIEFTALKYAGCCCSGHLNTQKKIDKGLNNFKCEICNSYYEKIDSLSRHIQKEHKDISLENYYTKYMMKPEAPNGKCLECGKELKFISIAKGFQKFCYNSSCSIIWHNKNSDRLQQSAIGIKRARASGNNIPTQLGYWLKKGFSEDEAKDKLKERQKTFIKENLIEKYGQDIGLKKWNERQQKWNKAFKKSNYSKVSQELFWAIYDLLDEKSCIFFAQNNNGLRDESGKNYEYSLRLIESSIKPDFIDLNKKRIIEFDGTYWHRKNPENKKREKIRDSLIVKSGYKVKHITESDWKINKQKCIDECMRFLNDN